jgi:Caspase recruitment domain
MLCYSVAELTKLRRPKPRLTRAMTSIKPPSAIYQQTSAFLIDCLVVNRSLLDDLRHRGVLDSFMVDDIMSRRNRPHRVIHLIRLLDRLGEQTMTEFIESLRTVGQQNIADTVEMRRGTVTVRRVDEPAAVAETTIRKSRQISQGKIT